jgi:hypothetical protein
LGKEFEIMTNKEREHLKSLLGPSLGSRSWEQVIEALEGGWKEALALDRICRRAEAALRVRAEYRQAEEHEVQVLWSEKFIATGMKLQHWSILRIGIANPKRWACMVADRGMEIIGGRLVLAVLREANNDDRREAEVLLVEQGKGMSVVPAIARVVKAKSGDWVIQGRSDKGHPALGVLCASVARGRQPDDDVYKAAQFVRMTEVSRLFERFVTAPPALDADGSEVVN